jgi:Protein of unknown function (DUF3631)
VNALAIAVELTKITKDSGAVTKRIYLNQDGSIGNDSSQCAIGNGRMMRLHLPDWRDFKGILEETPRNTAYALGALRPGLPDSVPLVRKRDPQSAQPRFATRTAGAILYRAEPSFVLCDFDTKGMPPAVEFLLRGFGGFRGALEAVCPAIAAAGHVSRRSTSANLTNKATGEAYQSNGAHLYLLVQDGTDARRFLYALHDRCWLAGLGWYIVGKAGQLLERSIADRMVCAPERLVFEASPDLEPPLKQEKREATVHEGTPLDTMAACADLAGAEHKELQRRKATAARALGKEIEVVRETFVSEQVEKAVSRGMDADKARHMAVQWGMRVLLPGAILEFDDPDLGAVSVDAILADPDRYDGETLADPVEGIAYGRNCAIVQVRDGFPGIFSFAHGGARYELRHDSGAQLGLHGETDVEIARLAKLRIADYERERRSAAKRLDMRATILDKLVIAERPADGSVPGQGRKLELPEPEPWPEPVDGVELLRDLRDTIKQFLVCSNENAIAISLWIAATWFEPVAQVAPILNIRSPMPRCGKTTLLEIIGKLSKRPLKAASITPAALFRAIELCLPTLIIDEADSFFGDNEDLRGIVNSGHTRQAAFVIRTVGEDHEPRQFSTWGFKAIAGIGKRAGTIEDRSIAVDLERKLRSEQVSRLRHATPGLLAGLQQKLCRWSNDNLTMIAGKRPSLPEALNDRQQDNWEILVAIADLAGGEWPGLARNAALSLSNAEDDTAPLSGQLLVDIHEIVKVSSGNGIFSKDLLDKLVALPESPWGECTRGKPLTQNRLAKMLGSFRLETESLRVGDKVQRGYNVEALKAAFDRYCGQNTIAVPDTPFQSATSATLPEINDLHQDQSATNGGGVALRNHPNPLTTLDVALVALRNPESRHERENGRETAIHPNSHLQNAKKLPCLTLSAGSAMTSKGDPSTPNLMLRLYLILLVATILGRTDYEHREPDPGSLQAWRLGWPERRQSGTQGAGQAARRAARQAKSEQALYYRITSECRVCRPSG